ncbi:hypothetical protein [Nocardia sp. NPDC057455]|uniref:hypothetical protein n=1 Tax=Nocardia sp. NPDC057455 TaxID=3346138 RepID=UPI00366B9231
MQRHRQRGLVGDGGAADGFAARSGGFVAFEGASGRVWARVEIVSEKIRPTPEARRESSWVSRD